jgi:hypothetical protein
MVKKILFTSLALSGLLFSTMPPACFADAAAQLKQAETYKQNEQYEQAEAIYRDIVADYPGTDEAFKAQKSSAISQLSETDLLTYLPEGAKLADIPFIQFGPTEETKKTRPNVFYADVDDDAEKEIIVAYYTPPHDYIIDGKPQEAFFRRAHVRVLDWDGTKYVEQWDSGGWGSMFLAGMGARLKGKQQQVYTDNYFNVGDINNDGKPEILFTRSSFGAEGSEFQALSWNGITYEQIAFVEAKIRVDDIDNDGIKEIICDDGYSGIKLPTPKVFRWNGNTYEMVREHVLVGKPYEMVREHVLVGKPVVSVRLILFLAILAAASLIGLILLAKKKASSRGKSRAT